MRCGTLIPLVACSAALGMFVSCEASGQQEAAPVPCLRTGGVELVKIVLAGSPARPAQEVLWPLASWDPGKTALGFRSPGASDVEQVPVKSLLFERPKEHMAAQSVPPHFEPIGEVASSYPAKEVTVVDGVLRLPGCVSKHRGNPLVFEGRVTFTPTTVSLRGRVFEEQYPSRNDSSDSTTHKGG